MLHPDGVYAIDQAHKVFANYLPCNPLLRQLNIQPKASNRTNIQTLPACDLCHEHDYVFIISTGRSGSTTAMAMLDSIPGMLVGGELHDSRVMMLCDSYGEKRGKLGSKAKLEPDEKLLGTAAHTAQSNTMSRHGKGNRKRETRQSDQHPATESSQAMAGIQRFPKDSVSGGVLGKVIALKSWLKMPFTVRRGGRAAYQRNASNYDVQKWGNSV